MSNLNVSIPKRAFDWVEEVSKTGRFSSQSEYISELIMRDQEICEVTYSEQELEEILERSFSGGVSNRNLDQIFESALASVQK